MELARLESGQDEDWAGEEFSLLQFAVDWPFLLVIMCGRKYVLNVSSLVTK